MYLIAFLSLLTASCLSTGSGSARKNELFILKKRVLTLERQLEANRQHRQNSLTTTSKRLTTNLKRLDNLEGKLHQTLGLIDALKVGVITGRYPGLEAGSDSIASAITDLQSRVQTIEETQTTLLKEFKTLVSMYGKKKLARKSKKRKKITSLIQMRSSFAKKRYRHVAEEGEAVVVKLEGNKRQEALYLLAESTFKLGKIRDAALHFNELVESGENKYATQAKIRLGDCFRHLGDLATAKLFYQDLIDNHPQSAEAGKATVKLESLAKK